MKTLKRYCKLIPLIIYPYVYLIVLLIYILVALFVPSDHEQTATDMSMKMIYYGAIVYNIYVLCFSIYHSVSIIRKKIPAYEAAKMNLVIKSLHIPSYCFHFFMGFIGAAMSIWGIGFLLVAFVVTVLSILLTGISSIGCGIRMKQEGILTWKYIIWMLIGSFICFADIGIAIAYVSVSRKRYLAETGRSVTTILKQTFSQNGD